MERLTIPELTQASNDPWDYCGLDNVCKRDCWKPTPCKIPKMVHKLATYEDTGLSPAEVAELAKAKSEGRLPILPCKAGTTVYCTNTGKTKEDAAASFKYDGKLTFMLEGTGNVHWTIERFGKTVFLTKESAEAALKERD